MKQFLLALVLSLAFVGCAQQKGDPGAAGLSGPQGAQGDVGPQGPQGANGHSLVSETVAASALECAVSGQRLDIYIDLDDSLSLSAGDSFISSLVACNGANGLDGAQGVAGAEGPQGEVGPQGVMGEAGPQGVEGPSGPAGPQGPQGETGAQGPAGTGATVQDYALTTVACTAIGNSMFAKKSGTEARIYGASNCSAASLLYVLDNAEHSLWLTSNRLGFNVNAGSLRVLKFD